MRVLLKGKEGRVGKTEYQGGVITPELMRSTKEVGGSPLVSDAFRC